MQIVVVKFRDPTTFNHWATLEDIDKSKCRVCFAVGVLIEKNDDLTKVALLASEDAQSFSDWIDIPTSSVLCLDVIKEIDWEEL